METMRPQAPETEQQKKAAAATLTKELTHSELQEYIEAMPEETIVRVDMEGMVLRNG